MGELFGALVDVIVAFFSGGWPDRRRRARRGREGANENENIATEQDQSDR